MRYRYRDADVEGEVELTADALELRSNEGAPLVVPFRDIDSAYAADHRVHLTLFPPEALEIYFLGPRYVPFCDEFFEKRNAALVKELFLADRRRIETFQGRFARAGAAPLEGRIDLFPRALVFFPRTSDPFFLRIAEIEAIKADPQNYVVQVVADDTVDVNYLGLRFEEFQERLRRTRFDMERRCGRMLEKRIPGAGALAPRMLDGCVVSESEADRFWGPLENLVCRSEERAATYRYLQERATASAWIGIQEIGGSDLDEVEGETETQHLLWYYVPIGPVVAHEIVSEEDHATYFYRAEIPKINRAWAMLQFRRDVILNPEKYPAAVRKLPHLREVTDVFVGRAIHNESWTEQVGRLVG